MGIGILGIILPVLPTVKFFIIASFFFLKSSEKLNNTFVNSKLYKKNVVPFLKDKKITFKNKLKILISVWVMFFVLMFIYKNIYLIVILSLVGIVKSLVILLFVKTRKNQI
jgi:hypothetical protein